MIICRLHILKSGSNYCRILIFQLLFYFILIPDISAQDLNNIKILEDSYPRGAFFRNSETNARDGLQYQDWDNRYSALMGIMGKTETEEWGENPNVLDYFKKFKEDHPDQVAIIHFNGNGRLPGYDRTPFFAGHWVHYEGTKILHDVPEESGYTKITVEDASHFLMNGGRYANKGDDITLTTLRSDGKPNWNEAEEVKLVSVNYETNTITVERGMYGTRALSFTGGNAFAAAHVTEGPWGPKNLGFGLLWAYNYSTQCPRDENDKNCVDILVEQLSANFSPSGKWNILDGIQFDVMPSSINTSQNENHLSAGHITDTDGDGKGDDAVFNGVNEFGIGSYYFLVRLREALGDDKLILADGQGAVQQRSSGVLNGTEQEGFPNNSPRNFLRWSMGTNMFRFWNNVSVTPKLVYTSEKRTVNNSSLLSEVPMSWHRLTEAAAVFESAAVFHNYSPQGNDDYPTVWDEIVKGTENELGWLGEPIGETLHLAETYKDELAGCAKPMSQEFLNHLNNMGTSSFQLSKEHLKVTAINENSSMIKFSIKNLPFHERQLYLSFDCKADRMSDYPEGYIRLIRVSVNGNKFPLNMDCFLSRDWSNYKYYFCNTVDPLDGKKYEHSKEDMVDIEIEIEGADPVYLKNLTVHEAPEIVYREFENGLVLANLSEFGYSFDMAKIFPGKEFQRLEGSDEQDPVVNNGNIVKERIIIPAKDALFLKKKINLQSLINYKINNL